MGRVMAWDVGDRRIGVAVTDPLCLFARPLETVDRAVEKDFRARLCELCREYDVVQLVVGLPLLPSGDRGEQAESVDRFLHQIRPMVDVPIDLWDESYTTVEAKGRMRSAGRGADGDKGRVDAVAAAVILEEWLAEHVGNVSTYRTDHDETNK